MTAIKKFTLMDEIPGAPASDNTICEYSGLMSVASYMETKETLYTEKQVREAIRIATTTDPKSVDYIIQSLKQPKNDK